MTAVGTGLIGVGVIGGLGVVFAVRHVRGASMLPTLREGDVVLMLCMPWSRALLREGRVIIAPRHPGRDWIKRVGRVRRADGRVLVWLTGDNASVSRDSRHVGEIALTGRWGIGLAVVSPWNERRWLL